MFETRLGVKRSNPQSIVSPFLSGMDFASITKRQMRSIKHINGVRILASAEREVKKERMNHGNSNPLDA